MTIKLVQVFSNLAAVFCVESINICVIIMRKMMSESRVNRLLESGYLLIAGLSQSILVNCGILLIHSRKITFMI